LGEIEAGEHNKTKSNTLRPVINGERGTPPQHVGGGSAKSQMLLWHQYNHKRGSSSLALGGRNRPGGKSFAPGDRRDPWLASWPGLGHPLFVAPEGRKGSHLNVHFLVLVIAFPPKSCLSMSRREFRGVKREGEVAMRGMGPPLPGRFW